jgi:hypothetical protein
VSIVFVRAFMALLSSVYDGGRLKFVGSDFTFNDFASFKAFVCTGERGVKSGEEIVKATGGGVGIGKLAGVLPAAAFFSICKIISTISIVYAQTFCAATYFTSQLCLGSS